jgi:hypothetical protein
VLLWPTGFGRALPLDQRFLAVARLPSIWALVLMATISPQVPKQSYCSTTPGKGASGSSRDYGGPSRYADILIELLCGRDYVRGQPWCWPPATPSGSCCAAPTTCSSCGATPAANRRLGRGRRFPRLRRRSAQAPVGLPHVSGPGDASDREPISSPSGWLPHPDESFQSPFHKGLMGLFWSVVRNVAGTHARHTGT